MPESFRLTLTLPTTPKQVFFAWLVGEKHAAMTGSPAVSEPRVGSNFTAWDGYITGTYALIQDPERIVMAWRTAQFPPGAPDSIVTVKLGAVAGGAQLTLSHKNIPDGQGEMYKSGWKTHYFEPMKLYFQRSSLTAPP